MCPKDDCRRPTPTGRGEIFQSSLPTSRSTRTPKWSSTDEQALHFHSDHYFLIVGRVRLRLPRWLGPGALTISHVDQGDERFAFVLSLVHPLFGEIIRQTGIFRERPADAGCGVVRLVAPPSPAPAASSPAG